MNVDDVLKNIGEFGKYQWMLSAIDLYIGFVSACSIMIVSFLTAEPDWICVKADNSSICNFTEAITLTSEHYKSRCDMPREVWSYVEGFTSVVTEVNVFLIYC